MSYGGISSSVSNSSSVPEAGTSRTGCQDPRSGRSSLLPQLCAGKLISAQLRGRVETHITCVPFYENEVAVRYLVDAFFGPGARENWRDIVLGATGERLNPDYLVDVLR
jgi:hypothetical protein